MDCNSQKIAIVLNEPYPYGMACSRRMHLYAKGLTEEGVETTIVIPNAQERGEPVNSKLYGNYQGVNFKYTCKSLSRSNNVLIRKWRDLIDPLMAFKFLLRLKPKKVLLVSNQNYQILLFKIVCILLGAEYYREKSEVPYFEKERISWFDKINIYMSFSFFDGIVVISDSLKNFFLNEMKLKLKVFVIPIIQEVQSFNLSDNKENKENKEPALLYTGSLLDHKDGISSIIKAVGEVKKEIEDVKLYITGNATASPDYQKVMQLIKNQGVEDNVCFTGYLSKEDLNNLMTKVRLLISVKPSNRQNKYNFPTKLGEYLTSGIPVLSNKSEVFSKYLNDSEEIYYTGESVMDISNSIREIFSNYTKAVKVGKAGKVLADKEFDYKYQVKNLKHFFFNEV